MQHHSRASAFILGLFLCSGLVFLGYFGGTSLVSLKMLDRTVTVKGLAERTVDADTAVWPISFREANNDLAQLYASIRSKNEAILAFLAERGFDRQEMSLSAPVITDRQAENYGDQNAQFRYVGQSTVSVYTQKVSQVLKTIEQVDLLGEKGIVITAGDYENRTQFLFTGLNEIKPAMIEEATENARQAAEKFARDSKSSLGKIKSASQGQFLIENRDSTTQHVKKVRVVSTIEYFLVD